MKNNKFFIGLASLILASTFSLNYAMEKGKEKDVDVVDVKEQLVTSEDVVIQPPQETPEAPNRARITLSLFTEIINQNKENTNEKAYPEHRNQLNQYKHKGPNTLNNMLADANTILNKFETEVPIVPLNLLQNSLSQYVTQRQDQIGKLKQSGYPFYNEVCIEKKELSSEENEICVIGDTHGSIHTLTKIFNDLKTKGYIDDNFTIIKNNFFIVLTGDYSDRGLYGTEAVFLILNLMLANPNKVFVLQGNHEDITTNNRAGFIDNCPWGFEAELISKYDEDGHDLLQQQSDREYTGLMYQFYGYLPQTLFLKPGKDAKWLVFCHGGFPRPGEYEKRITRSVNLSTGHTIEIVKCPIIGTDRQDFTWFDYSVFRNRIMFKNRAFPDDQQVFTKDDLVNKYNIAGVCRGHQHDGAGLKVWDNNTLSDWASKEPFAIATVPFPIFTFTTATEYALSTDVFYGIIKTNSDYTKWTLTPCLLERKPIPAPEEAEISN